MGRPPKRRKGNVTSEKFPRTAWRGDDFVSTRRPNSVTGSEVKSPGRILWLTIALLGFALGLRVAGIGKSLWVDEVGSYVLANSDDFMASARSDIHPPLYYTLLRGTMAVTHSPPLLRLISVGCGLLTIAVFLRLPSRAGALLAAALLACSPEMIANSQELRQ